MTLKFCRYSFVIKKALSGAFFSSSFSVVHFDLAPSCSKHALLGIHNIFLILK